MAVVGSDLFVDICSRTAQMPCERRFATYVTHPLAFVKVVAVDADIAPVLSTSHNCIFFASSTAVVVLGERKTRLTVTNFSVASAMLVHFCSMASIANVACRGAFFGSRLRNRIAAAFIKCAAHRHMAVVVVDRRCPFVAYFQQSRMYVDSIYPMNVHSAA